MCLSVTKLSLFIFLAKIIKQSVSSQLAVREDSMSNQRAHRKHSEHQNQSTPSIKSKSIQSEPINTTLNKQSYYYYHYFLFIINTLDQEKCRRIINTASC